MHTTPESTLSISPGSKPQRPNDPMTMSNAQPFAETQDVIYTTPKPAASRIPLLLRTPIRSRKPRSSDPVGSPPGIPFPTVPPVDKSHRHPYLSPPSQSPAQPSKLQGAQFNPPSPSISRSKSDLRLRADFEKYVNTTTLDPNSRVNPPASREVLVSNGIVPAEPEDEVLLSPISPCFTIPDYGDQGPSPGVTSPCATTAKPTSGASSSGHGSCMTSLERVVDPKTIVRRVAGRPPTTTGGSPLRYYAMLANSDNAAMKNGSKLVIKFT